MIQSNRFLLVWRSSATGSHREAFQHRERAEERLEEVRGREYFQSGAVVDAGAAGDTPEEFISRHREYHREVTARHAH